MFASGCFKTFCLPFIEMLIWVGSVEGERERKKPAHVGRIRKIEHWIRIVFGLPYDYKPNLSPFKPSCSVSTMSVVWQFRVTNRSQVNKRTWSNPRYNMEMFYFSVRVFETPNERASIYPGRKGKYCLKQLEHAFNLVETWCLQQVWDFTTQPRPKWLYQVKYFAKANTAFTISLH